MKVLTTGRQQECSADRHYRPVLCLPEFLPRSHQASANDVKQIMRQFRTDFPTRTSAFRQPVSRLPAVPRPLRRPGPHERHLSRLTGQTVESLSGNHSVPGSCRPVAETGSVCHPRRFRESTAMVFRSVSGVGALLRGG